MKLKTLSCLSIGLALSLSSYATKWTIGNSGNAFSPSQITINLGDTVIFNISNDHNAVQVSQSTYNSNGTQALAGGFNIPFGGGTFIPTSVGDHWFVCTPHASMGMKGIIHVQAPNAIKDVFVSAQIDVFPNPAQNNLSIRSSVVFEHLKYSIVNVIGKTVLEGTLTGKATDIDITKLTQGLYYIQIGNGDLKRVQQFIKQ